MTSSTARSLFLSRDVDPTETQEWLNSVDAVVDHAGRGRAREAHGERPAPGPAAPRDPAWLRSDRLCQHDPYHRRAGVPWRRGLEPRIRSYVRWNAAVMVHRAQRPGLGVGGDISTYASTATQLDQRWMDIRTDEVPDGARHVNYGEVGSPDSRPGGQRRLLGARHPREPRAEAPRCSCTASVRPRRTTLTSRTSRTSPLGGSSLSMRPASDVRRAATFRASRLSFSSMSRTPC